MTIYGLIMSIMVPSLINTIVNVLIFAYVRSSSRRVRPQIVTAVANISNTQEQRITRREISLLRQTIFMFSIFVGGWAPVHSGLLIINLIPFNPMIFDLLIVLAELSMLFITMNLFLCNHESREYCKNKIRQFFRQ